MANRQNRNQRSEGILSSNYNLCKFCAQRNDVSEKNTKEYYSITTLTNKKLDEISKCFICKGLFEIIDEIVKSLIFHTTIQNKYEFRSFFLGSSVPTFLFDNEDHLRSVFKIRGKENIKSAFNNEIKNKFRKILKKSLQPVFPDLMINLSVQDNFEISIKIKPRSYYLIGRYTKKKLMCQKSMRFIEFERSNSKTRIKHGAFNPKVSVETIIKKKLIELTASEDVKFTWMGSEDPNSMVLGKGRFFIAEIIGPQKRRINENQVFKGDGLIFRIEEKRESIKQYNINYISKIRAYVKTTTPIESQKYLTFKQLNNSIVTYRNKSRMMQKKVYKITAKKLDRYHFVVTFLVDSGLFIRQFIERKIHVTPTISSQIENDCICIKFDIIGIYPTN